MRVVVHVFFGFLLVVMLGAFWHSFSLGKAVPDVVAVVSVYLGLTARERSSPSMAGALVLGYVADLVLGTPKGLLAFSACSVCLLGHLVQGRLLVRGVPFTALFTACVAFVSGLIMLAVRARMGPALSASDEIWTLFRCALVTGLLGPIIFWVCRSIDARLARTRRERDLVLEGFVP
jgi:rod shape-determining protein MreD